MRLRSGNLRRDNGGSRVVLGNGDGSLGGVDIPDLNLKDESDVVSIEEGGGGCCEASKIEGKSNHLAIEKDHGAEDEREGTKIENVDNLGIQNGSGIGISQSCSTKAECLADVSPRMDVVIGDEKDIGGERVNCALGLSLTAVAKSSENENENMVCEDEGEESKEKNVEGSGVGHEAVCPQGLVVGNTTDGVGVSRDESIPVCVNGYLETERKIKHKACDPDSSRAVKTKSGEMKEPAETGIQVVGKVLRSRVVPAKSLTDEAVGVQATPTKRKMVNDDKVEVAVTPKDSSRKLRVDSMRTCNSGRPKRSNHSDGDVIEVHKAQCVSRTKDERACDKSVTSSAKKRKRGRPKKSRDHSEEQACQIDEFQVLSEVEDLDCRTAPRFKKDEHETPKTLVYVKEKDEAVNFENDAGDASKKSVGSLMQSRRSERQKRVVDYCEKESVQRNKLLACKVGGDSEIEVGSVGNAAALSSNKKRGRPKKVEAIAAVKRISQDQDGGDSEIEVGSVGNAAASSSKKKRGRPKNEEAIAAVKMISLDQDGNRKVSIIADPKGVPRSKKISSDTKVTSGISDKATSTSKGGDIPVTKNDGSVKRKRGETPGSAAFEKNSIRNQIVDMLLSAGWTVEYRPRNGREYNDAVYVNHEGKTHWSVTKAYFTLQREFEEGKLGNSNFTFTPLPDEILSKLFRVVSKTRSDKNKKKHKGEGDSSDDEDTRDKHEAKLRAKHKRSVLKRKGESKRRCALVARRSKGLSSESNDTVAHSGRHSILAWMIDTGVINLNGKVHYMNRRKTKTLLEGMVTRDGINCQCCKEVISVSEFEKHAGGKLCLPYENLYLESGQSLLQCLLDSWYKQESAANMGFHSVNVDADDPNDDTCAICGDGGDLMCCDSCPSTFHHDCLEIEEIPTGEWNCVFCSCKFCHAADEAFDDFDVNSSPLVTCCLCEEKYHESCTDEEAVVDIKSGRPTFCSKDCQQIYEQLQRFIGVKSDLGDGYSWTLLQRSDVKAEAVPLEAQKIQNNSKLAVALSVMDECFVTIIDPRSGLNLIRHVVYSCGSNINRLNFNSFVTVLLEKGDEVISAASVRVHGKQLAEMPFIGTRNVYRRQGMCQRLLTAIEQALSSIDVEKLVIPAVPELLNTWTSVFGFQPLDETVKESMRSMNMLVFAHTDMLQKSILKHDSDEKGKAIIENDAQLCKASDEQLSGGADKSEVDDGCVNGSFDLNVMAASVPGSSSDERHASCNSKDAGDEVKSRNGSGDLDDADKVEAPPSVMESSDTQMECSVLATSIYEGRALQPDLNLTEGTMCDDDVYPNSLEPSSDVPPCSAIANADESGKPAESTCGTTKPDLTVDHDHGGGNPISGERVVNPDLNKVDVVNENNHCSQPNLVDNENGEVNTIDTSKMATIPPGPPGADSENGFLELKFSSKCELHETTRELLSDQTEVSSNGSALTVSQLPGTSVECSKSDLQLKSVAQVTSDASCHTSSATSKSNAADLFQGNGVSKVGSN